MTHAGQIVLFRFPQTDLQRGKLRPALFVWVAWLLSMSHFTCMYEENRRVKFLLA
jgi:hypothetical protein